MRDTPKLSQWMAHVEKLDETREGLPSREAFLEIARDLGLDEQTLAQAEAEADRSTRRGTGFLRFRRYGDAIRELERALSLTPWRFEVVEALAQAHTERYRRHGEAQDRAKGKKYAHQLLSAQPEHAPAFELLNRLDEPLEQAVTLRAERGLQPRRTKVALMVAVGGATLVLVGAVAAFFLLSSPAESPHSGPTSVAVAKAPPLQLPADPPPQPADPPPADPPPQPPADPPPADPPAQHAQPEAIPKATYPLSVEVKAARGAEAVRLEVHHAELNTYGTPRVSAYLFVENGLAQEVSALKGEVQLMDDSGEVLQTVPADLLRRSSPPLRPQDRVMVQWSQERIDPRVRRARFLLEAPQLNTQISEWPEAEPICVHARSLPFQDKVKIGLRRRSIEQMNPTYDLEWENISGRAIHKMTIRPLYVGEDGEPLREPNILEHNNLALNFLPDLAPGGRQVGRFSRLGVMPPEEMRAKLCFELVEFD